MSTNKVSRPKSAKQVELDKHIDKLYRPYKKKINTQNPYLKDKPSITDFEKAADIEGYDFKKAKVYLSTNVSERLYPNPRPKDGQIKGVKFANIFSKEVHTIDHYVGKPHLNKIRSKEVSAKVQEKRANNSFMVTDWEAIRNKRQAEEDKRLSELAPGKPILKKYTKWSKEEPPSGKKWLEKNTLTVDEWEAKNKDIEVKLENKITTDCPFQPDLKKFELKKVQYPPRKTDTNKKQNPFAPAVRPEEEYAWRYTYNLHLGKEQKAELKVRPQLDMGSVQSKMLNIRKLKFEDLPNPESIKESKSELYLKHKSKEMTFRPKLNQFVFSIDPSSKTRKLIKRPKSAKSLSLNAMKNLADRLYEGPHKEWIYPKDLKDVSDRRECLDNYYPWMVDTVKKVIDDNPDLSKFNNPMLNSKKTLKDFNKTF